MSQSQLLLPLRGKGGVFGEDASLFSMAVDSIQKLSVAEYLEQERRAETKSEYLDGEVFLMAGASRSHNLLVTNVIAALHGSLRGRGCELYSSDMRVQVSATGLFTYPDVVVVCGEPEFLDAAVDTLLNPTLIVEVLSPSTADYDRGGKFAHYRALPSLREYLVLAQEKVHAEHSVRQADGRWLLAETDDPAAVLRLEAIGCELSLGAAYEGVIDRP